MRIALLGRFTITADSGAECPLVGEKPRVLLACLALRAGRYVEVEHLVDALWGEAPPASSASNLQTYASRIRRVLDLASGGGAGRVAHRSGAYRLEVADAECDVLELQRLSLAGQAAAQRADLNEAGRICALAARMPFGPVFPAAALARSPWLTGESRRVEELWMAAYKIRAHALLSEGRGPELVPDLHRAVAAFPLRERLHELLVRALCQTGDFGSALIAYQDARQALIEQLGVEPGPHLRRLHQAMLKVTAEGLDPDDRELRVLLHGEATGEGRPRTSGHPNGGHWFFLRGPGRNGNPVGVP